VLDIEVETQLELQSRRAVEVVVVVVVAVVIVTEKENTYNIPGTRNTKNMTRCDQKMGQTFRRIRFDHTF
jgi:hypothetical protein